MDTSELYWLSFKRVYQQVQAANRSSLSVLSETLNYNFNWLLHGLSKSIQGAGLGRQAGIAIDKHLANATVELSQLLTLDELQCHLLLKRWLKDNDVSLPPPAAAPATAASAGAGRLALPAPGAFTGAAPVAAAGAATKPSSSPGQAVLPLDVVQAVADYYAEERVYLAKCQQFVVMTALDVTADASKPCRELLTKLLEAGWEAKAFDSLAALLKPRSTAAAAAAGGGEALGSGAAAAPAPAARALRALCLLTQLYCGPDPSTSAGCHALRTRAAAAAADASEAAGGDAAQANDLDLLQELQALRWPECSEERLLQLLKLLGEAVFVAGAGAGGLQARRRARNSCRQRCSSVPPTTHSQHAYSHTHHIAIGILIMPPRLPGHALQACSLLLAALKPAQLLQRLAAAASSVQQTGGALPRGVCSFRQWRSVEAALMGWRPNVPGSVLALLAVYAYNQLLASYRGAADAICEGIQQVALQAGGFAAVAAPLEQEELAVGTLAGGLFRGLLLQGVCLMAAAFDLSPWRLPGPVLQQLLDLVVAVVADSPQLAQQVWDESLDSTRPLRHLLDETSSMFPACPGPFLQLATGLCQGRDAASAAYSYICSQPTLAVAYEAGTPGVLLQGDEAFLVQEMPWAKAPEVQGSSLPQGCQGQVYPLPNFARSASAATAAASDGGAPPAGDQGSFLVAWGVQAEDGIAPVLLLARAAHCLQQLHVANVARQAVAGSEYWQDLRLILQLLAALLVSDPLLAKQLLTVRIAYADGQQMDWLDVIIASLNVLPVLASTASAAAAAAAPSGLARSQSTGTGLAGNNSQFCQQVLAALADCLLAASAAAGCQPGRVLSALGACQLFAGAAVAPEPLPLVPVETLAGWVQRQQQAELSTAALEDWQTLETLQALQDSLEVPAKSYPLTSAVLHLTSCLLSQQCTWGLVPSLVSFTLHRVLGSMPWLPFGCASAAMSLASAALGVVRGALVAGAVAQPGAAGPKAAGAPGGVLITVLAAKVVHNLATAGHGYLSSVLPPSADALRDMAEQQAGNSALLAAGSELAQGLLLLVPVLLGALAHVSPEMPLQQYWAADPPGGGLSPAAIIASYATYPYDTHLPLLAVEALNAFAILQSGPSTSAGPSGLGYSSTPQPGSGGPPVPGIAGTPAGIGALAGAVQSGLNPAQPHLRGLHCAAAAAGFALGGAGGWWRPSGLFAALLGVLPELRPALLRTFKAQVAQEYPEWSIRSMTLLEAGISRRLPAAAAGEGGGKGAPSSEPPFSALDGLWQLLRQAPSLLSSQPKLLAGVLRVLSTLWECQGSAHGAVELLRGQEGFWAAIKACLPSPDDLPAASPDMDVARSEAAAWQLQVHACALHIVLLELLSVQVGSGAATADQQQQQQQQAKGFSRLLAGASQLGLQPPLMDQLARMLQVRGGGQVAQPRRPAGSLGTYLQLGATSLAGAWGPPTLTADALSVAAQLRAEVQPLLRAAAAGEYSWEDLTAACSTMAQPDAPRHVIAAAVGGDDEEMEPDGADGSGARGGVLVDALYARPFGEVLLGYAAVTPWSWGAGETEYGRQFLFDSDRLMQLLGPFVVEECEGGAAVAVTLDDVSGAAAVAHARLALLQAATSLFASLSRYGPARQELLDMATARELLKGSLQGVDKAMQEACRLSSSPASRLLAAPWGLPFIGHASSTALLLAARSMLLSVRVWKVAAASDAAAAAAGARPAGRPVLMARALNQQQMGAAGAGAGHGSSKGLPAAAGAFGGGGGGGSGPAHGAGAAALAACAQCTVLLSRWLRDRGGDSLSEAAAAAAGSADVSGAAAADVEVVECLSTSLLLMLQALPGQQLMSAAARASGQANNSSGSPAAKQRSAAAGIRAPAELLELEAALQDLLPVLCKACAMAVNQQQQQQQQGSPGAAGGSAAGGGGGDSSSAVAAAGAAAERGAAAAAAAAAAGAAVTDISVLELALSVAQATGLLDVGSLGFVGPEGGVYGSAAGLGGYDVSALMEVSLGTLGAYMPSTPAAAAAAAAACRLSEACQQHPGVCQPVLELLL
ncbi:hypothetical protein COO60DRAFT_1701205 [Scenedesmus sp. NREL 46B-D3]|nr:hypothetical protein COO60DRAFT_1701205 [Scenedesmus sp. NREL 46B-D3]